MKTIFTYRLYFIAALFALFANLTATQSSAQCANNNTLYTDISTAFDGDVNGVTCNYGGEYCTATVCNGVTYEITTSGTLWDTQITLYSAAGTYLAYNDDGTGDIYNTSLLTWTSTFDGTIRVLVDEYDCTTNTDCAYLTITQFGECGAACSFYDMQYSYDGCNDGYETISLYPYYSGDCTISMLSLYSTAAGWEDFDLTGFGFVSGEAIPIDLGQPNTSYNYYFTLSDGTFSDTYLHITGDCTVTVCSSLFIDYNDTGCINPGTGEVPSGDITPFYNGGCTLEGIYTSVNGGPYEYLDMSAYGFTSGDAIGLFFNVQNANYVVYYVLNDGSVSATTSFTTVACNSGETICDCAGTQLPIEATVWLGDGSLDDGTYYWNGDLDLPVDFNCATWGFDCADELPVGYFSYDPYGVCSGEIPPSNGCVDEFCYTIDLDVITDCHPEDIDVYVYNSNGDLVFTAGHLDFITLADNTYTFQMCLPADCYLFQITDIFGDGLNGGDCGTIGYAGIYDYSVPGYVVLAQGDAYLDVYSGEFCVGPQTVCANLELAVTEGDCNPDLNGDLLPTIDYTFDFSGPCTVQSIFYSVDGSDFIELDVSANGWSSGDEGSLYYLTPNSEYTIYYTTDDGASSYLYTFTIGNCLNEITICDCNGTQLSIGVTDWLSDGFADNGFYQWAGQYVNFNCSTWGYDCGDIDGSPSFDPYNVCDGQLPPFNGCIEVQDILGCMDPTAINYNPAATINDGSCIYNLQVGCTDSDACNYNDLAIVDDGSCEYISCVGCTDDTASNYDPSATIDDGSCIYTAISGCTNPNALNYDPLATIDDGSCILNCIWPTVAYDSHCMQGDMQNFYVDIDLTALGNGAPYTITNSYNNQQQVMTLMGSVVMGPFPNNTQVVIQVTSNTIECLLTSQPMAENCNVTGVFGCIDPDALNYNPDATIDDGSCIYVGVEEIENLHFTMYPNPARDQITISNTGNSPIANIRVLDNTGRLVKTEQVVISKGNNHVMNVSSLAQGNYVIEILTEGNIEHHNLIIQK